MYVIQNKANEYLCDMLSLLPTMSLRTRILGMEEKKSKCKTEEVNKNLVLKLSWIY